MNVRCDRAPPTSGAFGRLRCGGMQLQSALNLEIVCRRFALVRDLVVFDNLPLIQTAETSLLDRRNVDENVFSAATLRLNKSIPFLRIKPLHSPACHCRSSKDDHQEYRRKNQMPIVARRVVGTPQQLPYLSSLHLSLHQAPPLHCVRGNSCFYVERKGRPRKRPQHFCAITQIGRYQPVWATRFCASASAGVLGCAGS